LLGCVLLLAAGGWYVYNIVEDKNAGRQAAEILNKMDEAVTSIKDGENTSVIMVDGDAFCGRISIDKLGIELPVYDEWDYTKLKSAPCRYSGSIYSNDIVIAAHNYKSHFGALDKLETGDEIEFLDPYGTSHTYKVCEIARLDGTAVSDMHAGNWDFTLFTCTLSGEQRVTVRCESK